MTAREEVYESVPPFQIIFAVGTQGLRPQIPTNCPDKLASLMKSCWQEDSKLRVQHSYHCL